MRIATRQAGIYRVFSIEEDLGLSSSISQLKDQIAAALERGVRDVALRFSRNSYLSTRTIATLVNCFEDVKDRGGRLAIVDPNEDIVEILSMIDFDKVVSFFPTEELLARSGAGASVPA
jgi:anti-anti-sigma factor